MARVKYAKTKRKTTIEHFTSFLQELDAECPDHGGVIVSGHACTQWVNMYADRAWPGEGIRATSGKDLDLLIKPRVISDYFADREEYEPSYIYVKDMLFLLARRIFLRSAITPMAPQFIVRCGQVKVWSSKGGGAAYVDFFVHPFGWFPKYLRDRAVKLDIEGVEVSFMNPVHCLWNFILAAAVLNQRKGDQVKRFRKDHRRVKLLIPIIKHYLADLKEGKFKDSAKHLKWSMEDMRRIRKHKLTQDRA